MLQLAYVDLLRELPPNGRLDVFIRTQPAAGKGPAAQMWIERAPPQQDPECVRAHLQYRSQNLVGEGGLGVKMTSHGFRL